MTTYTLTSGPSVVRDDGLVLSADDPTYVAWLAAGGVPLPASVPLVTGRQINGQATLAGVTLTLNAILNTPTAKKPDDVRYVNSVGLDTLVPVDNPKVARVLALASVADMPAFMAAALLLPT